MTPEEFRVLGHRVVDVVATYLEELPDGPVWTPVPQARRELLESSVLGGDPTSVDDALGFVAANVLPHPFGNGHPRFFAWGNPQPALEGVLFDLVASAMNPSCAGGDHAAIYLERGVVRWLCQLLGYPGDGVLVGGGATAALTALAAARNRALRLAGVDERADGVAAMAGRLRVYLSDEAHASHRKAVRLLGIGDGGLVGIGADRSGRLDVGELAAALERDVAGGMIPCCVVASAGTVNTGAVHDLAAVADVCSQFGVWFHVDGSLGALGVLDPAMTARFVGMERADSLAVDPHKWLAVPVDCGAVLVRDLELLREAFSLVPPYLRGGATDDPWYSEYVFDQTRPFRALRLWATLVTAGRAELSRRITTCVERAARLERAVAGSADFELLADRDLQVVVFHPVGVANPIVVAAFERVRHDGTVFLTGTRIGGREAIRACFLNWATTESDVDAILPAVRQALAVPSSG